MKLHIDSYSSLTELGLFLSSFNLNVKGQVTVLGITVLPQFISWTCVQLNVFNIVFPLFIT